MLEMLRDNLLTSLTSSNFSITQLIVAIGLSLIASVAVYIIYQLFYGSRNIGAGVDRSFVVAGPAITALFLGIQSSIPLSLGLLGALSFVRFRTPVKDPAEIGYLLLLIATSIGAATQTYLIAVILFIAIFLALGVQWFIQNRFSFSAPMNFMIAVDKQVFADVEEKLTQFLESHLDNLIRILRFYELASGKRWTFRDLFSLVSQVLVGHEEDFVEGNIKFTPCDWAKRQLDYLGSLKDDPRKARARSVWTTSRCSATGRSAVIWY